MREVITLPAERRVLSRIAHLIDRYASFLNFNASELHDVQVAAAEACTNAIVHGLHEDPSRTFEFTIEAASDTLTIVLREDGTPFDPGNVSPADLTSGLQRRKIGGLGIYLIDKLMDSVNYSTESDGMKVVRMTKRAGGKI